MNAAPRPSPLPATNSELRRIIGERLHAAPSDAIFDPRTGRSWVRSDFDLNPELLADLAVMEPPRPAAVLIGIVDRAEPTVLFTLRTERLTTHSGQVSFPGGRSDPDDSSPIATALREAWEEIGLEPGLVEPLGYLDSYRTGTGYQIHPVVGLVSPGHTLKPNAEEVADVFEVPLAFLLDPANHQRHSREWRGRQRAFYAMSYGRHYIWGATAGMVVNLHERLLKDAKT